MAIDSFSIFIVSVWIIKIHYILVSCIDFMAYINSVNVIDIPLMDI